MTLSLYTSKELIVHVRICEDYCKDQNYYEGYCEDQDYVDKVH